MVIIGQELAGFTILAALDLPAAADAYRAIDAEENEVTLYVREDLAVSASEFDAAVEQLLLLSREVHGVLPVLSGGVLGGNRGWLATPATPEALLEDFLPRFRPLAFELIADIARILSGAHALGLVHGDLGPHNVVVTHDGVTSLKAFGFHRLFGAPCDEVAEAARYRAPELFDGRAIDARTDVYGLGVLLYTLLSGQAPGEEREDDDDDARALPVTPTPLAGLPAWVNLVLARSLARDPAARFQTIEDFVAALHRSATAPDLAAAGAPPASQLPEPDTVKTAPGPPARDTLPTGTVPPEAARHPTVVVVDPGKRRQRFYVAGALLVAVLVGSGATRFFAGGRVTPSGGSDAAAFPGAGAPPPRVPGAASPGSGLDEPAAPPVSPASQATGQASFALPQATSSPAPVSRQPPAPVTPDRTSPHGNWYSAHF